MQLDPTQIYKQAAQLALQEAAGDKNLAQKVSQCLANKRVDKHLYKSHPYLAEILDAAFAALDFM